MQGLKMDSVVNSIFGKLITRGTNGIVKTVRKIGPDLNIRSQPLLNAQIQGLFGNDFPQQLLDINDTLSTGFGGLKDVLTTFLRKQSIRDGYGEINERLVAVQEKYDRYVKNPGVITWKEFKSASETAKLEIAMTKLHIWITRDTLQKDALAKDLMDICDMDLEKYKVWQKAICLTFSQAYALRTAFLYYDAYYEGTSAGAVTDPTAGKNLRNNVLNIMKEELQTMEERSYEIVEALDRKQRQLKANFLLKKCGNVSHAHCGAANGEHCNELTATIYGALREEMSLGNDKMATRISNTLRNRYQQFLWSVIVFDDFQQAETIYDLDHILDIWVQRFGTKPLGIGKKLARESLIMSEGYGSYGYILCYRARQNNQKAALVFWIDPIVLQDADGKREHERLLSTWERDEKFQVQEGPGSLFRLMGKMKESGMNIVFGVGLNKKLNEGSFGFDLAPTDYGSFPVCLGKGRQSCFLTCLKPGSIRATYDLQLEGREYLVHGHGSKASVYKSHVQMNNNSPDNFVAVKEITLAFGQEKDKERVTQIDSLDIRLIGLRSLVHLNIVQHLGFQTFCPTDGLSPPKYQIIMEHLAGGTLGERVKKTVSLTEMVGWAKCILEGLRYLHDQRISHKLLHGDHLMFEGPKMGDGNLKIISVGRTGDILSCTNRSYIAPDTTFMVFQPPELQIHRGSKTDIYSFGCILIQMVTGKIPVVEKEKGRIKIPVVEKEKGRIKIPEGLPKGLEGELNRCLAKDYDARPTAVALLDLGKFDPGQYVNMSWICPSRDNQTTH